MLSEELKAGIQEAYRRFLGHRQLRPRQGQRQMIGAIARTLGAIPGAVAAPDEGDKSGRSTRQHSDGGPVASLGPICVVEAGTGTGKTLAYLLATLPIARDRNKTLVVATGTVALQSQLLDKDIPELMAATGWQYRFALAKGRGRYLCPLRLESCMDALGARHAGLFLFEDEIPVPSDAASERLFASMNRALDEGRWQGDRDAWPESVPDATWRALTVDRKQCAGHRCRKFSSCCFYQARENLERADCIVTNHDLVMADLVLGGGAILPPPAECIYVFDEAHRLAETTLHHFAGSVRLQASIHWLENLVKGAASAGKSLPAESVLAASLASVAGASDECLDYLRQAAPQLRQQLAIGADETAGRYRFANGDIGPDNRELCRNLAAVHDVLADALMDLSTGLEQALENPHHPMPRVDLEQLFQAAGQWQGRVTSWLGVWTSMALKDTPGQPPYARWLALEQGGGEDLVVAVSPISAAETLREGLWNRCAGAVATSATLRALGRFDRFVQQVGLPDRVHCTAVPGAFDCAASAVLRIPDIGADGGDQEAHTEALGRFLENLDRESGTQGDSAKNRPASLVLFASRKQMAEVAARVPATLRDRILMQGDYSNSEIIRRHRQRIDSGVASMIFGLASFAEGLDLPGDYCNHVLIAKLPFAVPDDPLHAAQAEWLESRGENAFMSMTLPDASLRLIQACGRLLRTEQDRGNITILDRRLLTRFYGRQMLEALPPYRRDLA